MRDIVESLYTLSHIATQINLLVQVSKVSYKNGDFLDSFVELPGWYSNQRYSKSVLAITLNDILIFANSYLDELQEELTPINYPNRADSILSFRKAIKPALRRIKKWRDLKEYRNEILVHNYRVKSRSMFSANHQAKVYNVPSKDQEILLLAELILLINKQMRTFFSEDVERFLLEGTKIIDRYSTYPPDKPRLLGLN